MKNLKKLMALLLSVYLLVTAVACSNSSGNTNGGGGGDDTVTVKSISSTILDGKIANFMGADGVGIVDKTVTAKSGSSTNPFAVTVYADGNEQTQKKSELVKGTEDGVADVCFHETSDGVKSYKELNKKFDKHHHNSVECIVADCAEISDEILQEESTGEIDTVLSLDARVNKLYMVGNFTFMSVSSAVEGNIRVLSQESMQKENFTEMSGYPTYVNVEDNFDNGFTFNWIQIKTGDKSGMIPIKVKDTEENYHTINYWSDDFNQSFIIDNNTGITYSLSQFKYIYSVSGGVLKVHDDSNPMAYKFDYYKPVVTASGITFSKINVPDSVSGKVYTDIYGNVLVSNNQFSKAQDIDIFGEKKVGDVIFAQKVQEIFNRLEQQSQGSFKKNVVYRKANVYHNGSDGRLYRINFFGDLTNVSVSVLDENGQWKSVESTTNVDFNGSNGYIAYQIGRIPTALDYYKITHIENGMAYFSTAAYSDGRRVWERADIEDEAGYVGVVKMPVNGFSEGETNTVKQFAEEFKIKGLPINGHYSVVLLGKTQMLYLTEQSVVLRDVVTGEEKAINISVAHNECFGHDSGNLFIKGLGYLNIDNELNVSTFGSSSFSANPIVKVSFDEYYKLITSKK